jgi:hypothetical protein
MPNAAHSISVRDRGPRNATGKNATPLLRERYGAENLVDRENQG